MTETVKRGPGRPPSAERTVRTTISLYAEELRRLDSIPCATRSDRVRWLMDQVERQAEQAINDRTGGTA